MAEVYDVVCCNCGAIMSWYKYDTSLEYCKQCNIILSRHHSWTNEAMIFGIKQKDASEKFSKGIREQYHKRFDMAFKNPSFRVGKI